MKECFLITSYCDTEQKNEILKKTISNLKKFGHFPLSAEIQKDINYLLYSKNFIIGTDIKVNFHWMKFGNYKLYNYKVNYNYSVLKQIGESVSFLFNLDYDVIHFLNYDSNISEELYLNSKNEVQKGKSVFYENFLNKDYIIATWFSILKKDQNKILDICDLDNYSISDKISIESYLGDKINNEDFTIIGIGDYDYKKHYLYEISMSGKLHDEYYQANNSPAKMEFETFFKRNGYYIFGGYLNGNFAIYLYNVKEEIKLIMKLKDKKIELNLTNDILIDTLLNIYDLEEAFNENESNLIIQINDDEIDKSLLNRFLKNKIEIINNDIWQ